MGVTTEEIDGLRVDRAAPTGEPRPIPLLLVHGLWADSWVWDRWLPHAASRGWDTWAIHLRGRSGSRPVADLGKVRMADFARDVRDALERIGPAVVVGHSMGGLVVQMVTAMDERVRASALVCAIPPRGIVALSGPMIRRSPRFLPALLGGRPFVPRRADARALICNASPPDVLDAYMARALADSGTAAREIALGVRVDAGGVRCPVLVLGTGEDRISPRGIQPKLAGRYGAELLQHPGLDHVHMIGPDWQGPADAVLDWAERAAGE